MRIADNNYSKQAAVDSNCMIRIVGLTILVALPGSGRLANPNPARLAKWVGRVNPFN